jgi:zinc finger protein, putative
MAISTQIDDYTLNFSENLEGNVMLENLRSQREMGKFCDIVLHVQGKRFPAHRSVLAASSPYFESVLKNHRVTKEEITIGWHDVKTFEILLDYMYTGNVVINETNVYELLKLSNHFLISKLKDYTGQYLEKFMTAENCLNIKELADKYNLTALQESALNVIRDNITSILESGPLMELSAKKFELFITDPGTGCDTVPLSLLLNAISSWVKMDIPRRSNDLSRLLDVINWKENDAKEVFAHIENETLYQENGWCLYLILKTLIVNQIDLQGKFVSQYESLRKMYEKKLISNDTASNEIIVAGTSLNDLEESKEEAYIDDTPIIVEPVEVMTDATPVGRRRNRKRAITIKGIILNVIRFVNNFHIIIIFFKQL